MGVRIWNGQDGARNMVFGKAEGKEWAYMQDNLCIPTLWENLNIIYGPCKFICSTNKVSQSKRVDTLSLDFIQITVSAGNQKWKQNDKITTLIMDAKRYLDKVGL